MQSVLIVGDTVYSFAYDGNRKRKWNLVTLEYGETWQVGDVIGSTIDFDIGSIHFYRWVSSKKGLASLE